MPKEPANRVRAEREARALSQAVLAERTSLSRQSISAIEAGRSTPSVEVALRIARALECTVEELFGRAVPEALTAKSDGAVSGRCALARVGERWVSYPLDEDGLRLAADGIATGARRSKVEVEPLRARDELEQTFVLMGCAAGLGILADRLNQRPGPGRFLWLARSSAAALKALVRQHTHVAGVHLVDARTGEANVAEVQKLAHDEPIVLITLARWEAGLVTRPEARRVRTRDDLGLRGLRIVGREAGSGAQRLLERTVRGAGLDLALSRAPHLRATGHLEVARLVQLGAADTGVATRDAALAFGLEFVSLAEERYDLAVPRSLLTDPRMERLCNGLVAREFRRELSALGYDVAPAGQRVAEVPAA